MQVSNANAMQACIATRICTDGRTDGLTKNRQAKRDYMTLSNAREIQARFIIDGETA